MSKINLDNLSETIGNFIEYWGFKKAHGKAWTIIYLSETPLSSKDLKERLGISKASLSNIMNDLKEHKVIFDAGKTVNGAELFVANPNIVEAIRNVLSSREKKLISEVRDSLRDISKLSKSDLEKIGVSKDRLSHLSKFVRHAQKIVNGIIKFETVVFKTWNSFKKT